MITCFISKLAVKHVKYYYKDKLSHKTDLQGNMNRLQFKLVADIRYLVQTIIVTVRGQLNHLTPPKDIPNQIIQESKDQKELYKVYGLLLSPCKIRQFLLQTQ